MSEQLDGRRLAWIVANSWRYKEPCGVAVELGLNSGRRIDAVSISYGLETRGAEVKVSRSDFFADDKWAEYLRYCDFFYFAIPEGLVTPDEFRAKAEEVRKQASRWELQDGYPLAFGGPGAHVDHVGLIEVGGPENLPSVVVRPKRNPVSMLYRMEILQRMAMRAGDPDFCPRCGTRATARAAQEAAHA